MSALGKRQVCLGRTRNMATVWRFARRDQAGRSIRAKGFRTRAQKKLRDLKIQTRRFEEDLERQTHSRRKIQAGIGRNNAATAAEQEEKAGEVLGYRAAGGACHNSCALRARWSADRARPQGEAREDGALMPLSARALPLLTKNQIFPRVADAV